MGANQPKSNVPNAFRFSRRSRKRYNAETVPQAGTASQGTILCKVARNSVNRRCPMTIRVRAADSFGVFRGITDDSDCGERARQLCRSGVKEGCASRVSALAKAATTLAEPIDPQPGLFSAATCQSPLRPTCVRGADPSGTIASLCASSCAENTSVIRPRCASVRSRSNSSGCCRIPVGRSRISRPLP